MIQHDAGGRRPAQTGPISDCASDELNQTDFLADTNPELAVLRNEIPGAAAGLVLGLLGWL